MEKTLIGGRKFVVVDAGGDAGLGTTISDTLVGVALPANGN
jgi:glucose dehydrogenase